MKLNIVLGRFQPLHNGHKALIDYALSTADHLLILVGSNEASGKSKKDPFSFQTRKELLSMEFPTATVIELKDHASDEAWLESISKLLKDFEEYSEKCFVAFDKDANTTESNKTVSSILKVDRYFPSSPLNATDIRQHFYTFDIESVKALVPEHVYEYLKTLNESIINISNEITNKLKDSEEVLEDILINYDLSTWKESMVYKHIDKHLVLCQECNKYRSLQDYSSKVLSDIYNLNLSCNRCVHDS